MSNGNGEQMPPLALANPFTPSGMLLGEARSEEGESVPILRIESACGSFMFGMNPEQMVSLGRAMVEMGESKLHGGLTVVRNGGVIAPRNGKA